MKITNKLIAFSTLISCVGTGAGFAVFRFAPTMSFALTTAIALAGCALLAVFAGLVLGRSTEKELGAGPAELRYMTSELASGYLNARHAVDAKEGAAADLARAIDRLSEVFRASKAATRSAILAGYKIRSATFDRYLGEAEHQARAREIAHWADELLANAQVLGEAIAYYSFAPEKETDSRPELAFRADEPTARASEAPEMVLESVGNTNAIHEAIAKPALRLLPRVERRPARLVPRSITRKLTLLPKPKRGVIHGAK
jgi:hypothetical protein